MHVQRPAPAAGRLWIPASGGIGCVFRRSNGSLENGSLENGAMTTEYSLLGSTPLTKPRSMATQLIAVASLLLGSAFLLMAGGVHGLRRPGGGVNAVRCHREPPIRTEVPLEGGGNVHLGAVQPDLDFGGLIVRARVGTQDSYRFLEDLVATVPEGTYPPLSQDAAAVKALMTEDHVSVTPYYGAPLSVAEVIASLPDLKIKQTNLTEPTVAMLAPDVAMRTLTAKLSGSFKGETFDERVFIISIMVQDNGKWLERFYEVTRLGP